MCFKIVSKGNMLVAVKTKKGGKQRQSLPPPSPAAARADQPIILEPGMVAEGDVAVIGGYLVTTLPRHRPQSYSENERRSMSRNRSRLSQMEEVWRGIYANTLTLTSMLASLKAI